MSDRHIEVLPTGGIRITETDLHGVRLAVVIENAQDAHDWLITHGAECADMATLTSLAEDSPEMKRLIAEVDRLAEEYRRVGNDVMLENRGETLDRLRRERDAAVVRVTDYLAVLEIARAE
jgi:hypothetical protein